MSGSPTRGGGETFAAFPAHAQPPILRIWQEAHAPNAESTVEYHHNNIDGLVEGGANSVTVVLH